MKSISNTNRPTYTSIAQENKVLKARIAELESNQGPISVDPQEGSLRVDDLSLGQLRVEELHVRAPALRKASRELENIETWTNGSTEQLKNLTKGPVVVDSLKARIPLPFVNSIMEKIAGEQMSRAGLSEVSLSQGEDQALKITGKVKKGIKLPFEVTGNLGASADGKVKFSIQSSKLMGLPMPNFLVSVATRLAGDSLARTGVEVDGNEFTLDTSKAKPRNVIFQMETLSVENGAILVDGTAPTVRGKSKIPRVSRAHS